MKDIDIDDYWLVCHVINFSHFVSHNSSKKINKTIFQYVHQYWMTEDGLPLNSITSVTQTKDGYIWLGSKGGVIRFDGVNFTLFNTHNTSAL